MSSRAQNGSKTFNKNTFLGILMHSVFENYVSRKCSIDDYHSLWEELFNKMINAYEIEVKDIEIIKYHLPFYEVKKNKLRQLLKTYKFKIDGFDLFPERKIRGGVVSGTADIIFENPSEKKVRIIDFKTGPIVSYENAKKKGIIRGYILQLMTYGYVYWRDGYLAENIICALQGVSGDAYEEIVFTNEEYREHENLLLRLKADINQAINQNNTAVLANPCPNVCVYCDYNSSCSTLHNRMNSELNFNSLSLLHEINSESYYTDSKVTFTCNEGKQSIHNVPKESFKLIKKSLLSGKTIFVSGLYESEIIHQKHWTRHTKFSELKKNF